MTTGERPQDVYEQIAAYPKPPLVPLPELDDLESLARAGLKIGGLSRRVVKAAMFLSGFTSFQKRLPQNLEHLLRRTNMRLPGLFAPVISATLALEDDPRKITPIERAATLLFAARNLYDDITAGKLAPDEHKGQILEMGQYPNLFSTCMIIDGRRARVFKSSKVSQVTVVLKGRLYLLEVGHLGTETTLEQLAAALTQLVDTAQSRTQSKDASPCLLTCADTATQSRAFYQMQEIDENAESLSALRHSFLTLCLDLDNSPSSHAEAALVAHSGNCENRWYHSSLQLVVFGNAKACAICNFTTYLDGNTMMRGAAELQKRAVLCPIERRAGRDAVSLPPATELRWQVDEAFIQRARKALESVLDNQQATFEIPGIGRDFFTAHNIQPVPAFVAALQMTGKRLTGEMVKISQFLAMSKYRCTDLVTAVVTTPEMTRFVDYVESDDVQCEEAIALLQEAIASQARECREARKYLPLPVILTLFSRSMRGVRWLYQMSIFALTILLLRIGGCFRPIPGEVVVSHPEIYPEVPLVGRPGVRLPYAKYFGLHYQIFEDSIVITMMPGVSWTISNAEFIAVLRESLERIQLIVRGEQEEK